MAPSKVDLSPSASRYCAVMFPFFIWLATIRSRAVVTAIVVAFAMLYALCLALFSNVYPLF